MTMGATPSRRRRLRVLSSHVALPAAAECDVSVAPLEPGLVERFDRDGFVNAGELLSHQQVADLSAALDRLIETGPDGFGTSPAPLSFRSFSGSAELASRPNWQIMNCWESCAEFLALIYHPTVVRAVAQLLRTDSVAVWHDQVQYTLRSTVG